MDSTALLSQLLNYSISLEKEILELEHKMSEDQLIYESILRDYVLDLYREDVPLSLDFDPLLTLVNQNQGTTPLQQIMLDNLLQQSTAICHSVVTDTFQRFNAPPPMLNVQRVDIVQQTRPNGTSDPQK